MVHSNDDGYGRGELADMRECLANDHGDGTGDWKQYPMPWRKGADLFNNVGGCFLDNLAQERDL